MTIKHNHAKRGKVSTEYHCWRHMIQRCENPNNPRYKDWGGRGVQICKAWHDFRNFYADMGNKPEGLTLDRIDNEGNYESGNCRWATRKEQNNNSRPKSSGRAKQYWFQAINPNGKIFYSNNQHEFAREYGLDPAHVSHCLLKKQKTQKGWTFQRIEEKII